MGDAGRPFRDGGRRAPGPLRPERPRRETPLVATGQVTVYLVRERGHLWASRPSTWMLAATVADLVVVTLFATDGILMAAVPLVDVAILLAAVCATTLGLDFLKRPLLAGVRTNTTVSGRAIT